MVDELHCIVVVQTIQDRLPIFVVIRSGRSPCSNSSIDDALGSRPATVDIDGRIEIPQPIVDVEDECQQLLRQLLLIATTATCIRVDEEL